jgi:hypothetical protein
LLSGTPPSAKDSRFSFPVTVTDSSKGVPTLGGGAAA